MTLGKLLGSLSLIALSFGAVLGALAGTGVSLISEYQALSDPSFAGWSSGDSWLGTTVIYAFISALVGLAAGIVSFLGAAAGLLLRQTAQPQQSRWPMGAAAGLGSGIFTVAAAVLLLSILGLDPAAVLPGVGLVLLSSTLAAFLSSFVTNYLTRRSPVPPIAGS